MQSPHKTFHKGLDVAVEKITSQRAKLWCVTTILTQHLAFAEIWTAMVTVLIAGASPNRHYARIATKAILCCVACSAVLAVTKPTKHKQ